MATITRTTRAKEAIKDRLIPGLESLKHNARGARRAIVHRQRAAKDFVVRTALRIRWRPLMAPALTAGSGALAGCLIGFALGRRAHGRTRRWR